jgi:hypothetical protein
MTPSHLLTRCGTFCTEFGMSEARLSTILFGSGRSIERLKAGRDVTTRVLERAAQRLNELEKARSHQRAA